MELWYAMKPMIGQYINELRFKNHIEGENVWIDGVLATSLTQEVSDGAAVKIGNCIWTVHDWSKYEEKDDPDTEPCPHCGGTGRL